MKLEGYPHDELESPDLMGIFVGEIVGILLET